MIRDGANLADAAIDTGFADQSHFHRSFTRRYGLTPGAYAAAMR
jgi:AraC-like DNA-binding protein